LLFCSIVEIELELLGGVIIGDERLFFHEGSMVVVSYWGICCCFDGIDGVGVGIDDEI
jgi:hypothetical protein